MSYGNPEVTVTPFSFEAVRADMHIDLGERAVSALCSTLLNELAEQADKGYMLKWQGSARVPRGVTLGSRVIAWTQHGRVISEAGEHFGVYERLLDAEGPNRDSEMMVLTFPEQSDQQLAAWDV
jgi:hypothetical protein